MAEHWKVTFWGVRGSIALGADGGPGGNTACLAVEHGPHLTVLDAGTGIYPLGRALERARRPGRLDILISHLHLDHILGLITFPPLWQAGWEIHLYGPVGFRARLDALFAPPYWTVGLSDAPADVICRELSPGEPFQSAGLEVTTLAGDHPGGCLYYRLEGEGKALVYALDCELTPALAPRLTHFARGADLLVWDAHFSPGALRPGWGHSTWEQGAALAAQAGVKQTVMTHFSPTSTAGEILAQAELARSRDRSCRFAREGEVIEL